MRTGILLLMGVFTLAACEHNSSLGPDDGASSKSSQLIPPVADTREHLLTSHGQVRNDPYYWLRDDERKDTDVLAYLEAENAYAKNVLADVSELETRIFDEMVAREKADDSTVPSRYRDYWYYERYEQGKDHPIYARRKGSETGPEQILLDENKLAQGYEYFHIENYDPSPDNRLLAFAADRLSRNNFDIQIKNLDTGEMLPDLITHVSASLVWAADNKHLFYVRREQGTLIDNEVWRHKLGTDETQDVLIYRENDPQYHISVYPSRDGRHIVIGLFSTLQNEYRYFPIDQPFAKPVIFLPRRDGHDYQVLFAGKLAYVRSNRNAENFRIMRVALDSSQDESTWKPVVEHRENVFISDYTVFNRYLVTQETESAINRLRVVPLDGGDAVFVSSDEQAYSAAIGDNWHLDTDVFRYSYSSLTTPETIYDLDLSTNERVLKKRAYAGENFDPANYETSRVYAKARDGERIPVSLLYRRGIKADGKNPLYVLGYGAYGSWYEPAFRSNILPLVDRGFVFAIAHIRGGDEMGRRWYNDGRLLNKKNTFYDFFDVAEHLVATGWAADGKVVGMGRSAGGLLIGTVANMNVDTFDVLVTEVPFVDLITTMEDETIPLTTFEYDEWGNPADKTYYDYMMSYSPYDRIEAQNYASMIVSTGLWDSQVQYFEPAKWVAKLRAHKTDDNLLLFHTNMSAGHRGGSGRFDRLRDTAREHAFVLKVLDLTENH